MPDSLRRACFNLKVNARLAFYVRILAAATSEGFAKIRASGKETLDC